MRRRYVLLLAIMVVAQLTLAACMSTSGSGTSPAGARTAVCNGLTTVNNALTSLSNVNADSTVGDVKSAQEKVTKALSAIESRIPSGSGATLNQLKQANDQLTAKIQGYPDETPIGQTSAKVQDIKATVATAQSKTSSLSSSLKCNP